MYYGSWARPYGNFANSVAFRPVGNLDYLAAIS
jgi:hypothetical protein